MLMIDRYAYTNRLAGVHPAEKLLFAGVTLLLCLCAKNPAVYAASLVLMAGAALLVARIPALFYARLMCVPVSFLLVSLATLIFSTGHGAGDFIWGFSAGGRAVGIRPESVPAAGILLLKSVAALSCLYFLSLTTPANEIFLLLRRLRVPPLFVEMMELVYRFIFVLLETAARIVTSQSSRLGYGGLKNTYHSMGRLFAALLVRAFYRSRCLAVAMESRCGTGEIRFLERTYRLSPRNLGVVFLVEAVLVAMAVQVQ
ncbi:MAG: cobalt ECF transporter T component CbiQ [Firmicutes bacterium]|nr:cobalt ECF transporter T component CbiQ [Bacillota bacterium]